MRLRPLALLCALGLPLLAGCAARIVDPAQPGYDRSAFTIEDYKTYKLDNPNLPRSFAYDCEAYFPLLIRKGMPRRDVEHILVQSGGARATTIKPATVRYAFVYGTFWSNTFLDIDIAYDKSGKVDRLTCREKTHTPPRTETQPPKEKRS